MIFVRVLLISPVDEKRRKVACCWKKILGEGSPAIASFSPQFHMMDSQQTEDPICGTQCNTPSFISRLLSQEYTPIFSKVFVERRSLLCVLDLEAFLVLKLPFTFVAIQTLQTVLRLLRTLYR